MLTGDFEKALADLDEAVRLSVRPGGPLSADEASYARLQRYLILERLHRGDPAPGLATAAAAWRRGWPRTIGQFLTGKLSEDEFLFRAEQQSEDGKSIRDQRCEALYYVGMRHLLRNDPVGAGGFFARAQATHARYEEEWELARAEAARLPAR
jgi:lipoprotein NlpI